jgi:hypothetical protein
MATCKDCTPVCDPVITTKCIKWKGKTIPFTSFESLIENLYDEVQKYGVNEIDIKTLSTSTTLKKDDIIQILIDEIIKLKKTPTTSTILDCDLDLTLIGEDCTNCLSICSKLQKMLAAIAVLQSDVEFLKTQI